jgi:hypothetical protein
MEKILQGAALPLLACYKRSIGSQEKLKRKDGKIAQDHRLRYTILTAYPAIAGGAAKTNSEGGESF